MNERGEDVWLCPNLRRVDYAPPVQEAARSNKKNTLLSSAQENENYDEETSLLVIKDALYLSRSLFGEVSFWILALITGGLWLLLVRWFPRWEASVRYRRTSCADVDADFVCCCSLDNIVGITPIQSIDPASKCARWIPVSRVRNNQAYRAADAQLAGESHNQKFPLPRTFMWRHERYWYDASTMNFVRRSYDLRKSYEDVHKLAARNAVDSWPESANAPSESIPPSSWSSIFSSPQELRNYVRLMTYGQNVIDVKAKPFLLLVLDEALRPFFMFQVFSMTVWYFEGYVIYAYTILGLSVTAVLHTSFITWQNMRNLEKVVEADYSVPVVELSNKEAATVVSPAIPGRILGVNSPDTPSLGVRALGPRPWSPLPTFRRKETSCKALLPGDLVEITANMVFSCDIILLSGSVVVNESMLTGESAPVQKTPLPYAMSSASGLSAVSSGSLNPRSEKDSKYFLYAGTRVVQAKPQGAIPCHPLLTDTVLKQQGPHYYRPDTVWQFSMEQSTDVLRRYLTIAGMKSNEIEERVSSFQSSFKSRERSLPVIGIVARTGFNTAKGQLVRSILFPKPSKFDFDRQIVKFIVVLALVLISGCLATVAFAINQNEDGLQTFLNCLNLITITIPPALPLALSIAISAAFVELEKKRVFCINPNRIVAAGRINVLCFDKTGTLTEDGLTLKGVQVVQVSPSSKDLSVSPVRSDLVQLYSETLTELGRKFFDLEQKVQTNQRDELALSNMAMSHTLAACHSLAILEDNDEDDEDDDDATEVSRAGKETITTDQRRLIIEPGDDEAAAKASLMKRFVGDPLEIQMFVNTNWTFLTRPRDLSKNSDISKVWNIPHIPRFVDTILYPPSEDGSSHALAILKRYDFDAEIRRMGTLVYHIPLNPSPNWNPEFSLLVKGAPENIKNICRPETVPVDFEANLQRLALSGYRILACAYKPITLPPKEPTVEEEKFMKDAVKSLLVQPRDEMEKDLIFTGLLVMENSLKPETIGALESYVRSGLRCIMVTGDNPLTAYAVARQCSPFFIRPSRKSFLLDLVSEGTSKPTLMIQDLLDPTNRCEFNSFLRSKELPASMVHSPSVSRPSHSNAPNSTHSQNDASLQSTVGDSVRDIDVVVTGPAFAFLQVEHDELIAQRQAMPDSKKKRGIIKRFFQSQNVDISELLPLTPYQVVLTRANIFARMTPKNKQDLMGGLQDLSFAVCMTGDGANDSGALKAADVGLSIQAKKPEEGQDITAGSTPSIAAPFSTPLDHIGAVAEVLLEGRSCIVSTFSMFRFMFCYGLIQFTSVVILYRSILELGDYQYIWADLGLVFPLAITMPLIKARETLSRGRPESDLVSATVFRSVFGLAFIIVAFQIGTNEYFRTTSGYVTPNDDTDPLVNQDSTESFTFANFQYSGVGLALSQSFGIFRQSVYQNIYLTVVFSAQFVMNSLMMIKPYDWIKDAFQMDSIKEETRWTLWVIALVNTLFFICYERFFVPHQSLDEDPIDVDDVIAEIKERPVMVEERRYSFKSDKPDYQPTLFKRLRWQKPNYVVAQQVASPVWTALTQPQ